MSPDFTNPVVRFLHQLVGPASGSEESDADLLQRFVRDRDGAAFEALMRRHGPLVLGVCRRMLLRAQDVEDAFQATFLVLVRKAGSIRRPERLANWLYGVALRTAAKARGQIARRRAEEGKRETPAVDDALSEVVWRDLRPILDEEIRRLPEKYRLPFLLCYLEGQTNEQAAQQLGCPKGTVLSRLAWARERLRARLTRRGLTLSGAGLAALLTERAAPAEVPVALVDVTGKAALAIAAGKTLAAGRVAEPVAVLVEGVLKAMMMTKVKQVCAAVLVAGLLGAGGGLLVFRGMAAEPPNPPSPAKAAAAPQKADLDKQEAEVKAKLKTLAEAKRDAAVQEFDSRMKQFLAGRGTQEFLLQSAHRLLESRLALCASQADRIEAYQAHFDQMKVVEEAQKERFDGGLISSEDVASATYCRLEAEIWLTQAKAKAK